MASKKREVQLQAVINSQNLWDEMLLNKGLTASPFSSDRCLPSLVRTLQSHAAFIQKTENELNEDEILHFVVAEADSIPILQPFRDKCEPLFLFSLNGKFIEKIHGANAPLINRKVLGLIDEERKIAAGELARPQHAEILLADSSEEEAGESRTDSAMDAYNMAIFKPDAVLRRKNIEIKEKIAREGYLIEAQENMFLPEELVRAFYSHMADQPDFEEFVFSVVNGLSCVLIISQGEEEDLTQEENQPQADTEEEPLENPEEPQTRVTPPEVSKRNGTDYILDFNSLQEFLERQHVSEFCDILDDVPKVSKFIDILFPNFKTMKSMHVQKTLALIYPEVYEERKDKLMCLCDADWKLMLCRNSDTPYLKTKDEVLNIIQNEGFIILMQRQISLSEEEARTLCKTYENEDYFNQLISYVCSDQSYVLVLLRENAVDYWQYLIGPKTVDEAFVSHPDCLCAQFATESLPVNQFYGSSSKAAAEKEIEYFFPPQSTLALIKPHVSYEHRAEILKTIKEAGFELTLLKEIHLLPEHANKIYFKITGRDFYKHVLEVLSMGNSIVMVLTKWNAVAEWKRMIGPGDPEEAKLISPDCLRAKYGVDILRNAVHGASSADEAAAIINTMFPENDPETTEH